MWFLYAGLSALTAALMTIVGKIGLQKIDPTLATTIRSAIMFIFMLLAAGIFGKFSGLARLDNKAIGIIAVSAIFGALSWLFYFLALKDGSASSVAAIDRTSIVFIVVLTAVLGMEKLTWQSGIGALLIAIGAAIIVWPIKA